MAFLTPCDGCNRHVMSNETACPFCGVAVTREMRARQPSKPKGRLGRAAMMAIGASLAATPVACGGDEDDSSNRSSPATSGTPSAPASDSDSDGEGGPGGMGAGGGASGGGSSVDPSPDTTRPMTPEGEPSAVALYGVAIMPTESRPVGVGGAPPNDPVGEAGAPPMQEPVAEPEPFAVAAYGVPPMLTSPIPTFPSGGAGGGASQGGGGEGGASLGGAPARDAGADEPEPDFTEPEPLGMAEYGVPPLEALD